MRHCRAVGEPNGEVVGELAHRTYGKADAPAVRLKLSQAIESARHRTRHREDCSYRADVDGVCERSRCVLDLQARGDRESIGELIRNSRRDVDGKELALEGVVAAGPTVL